MAFKDAAIESGKVGEGSKRRIPGVKLGNTRFIELLLRLLHIAENREAFTVFRLFLLKSLALKLQGQAGSIEFFDPHIKGPPCESHIKKKEIVRSGRDEAARVRS